jgi:hypothetical protein
VKYLPSYYEELEREVAELAVELAPVLSEKQRRWIEEWIKAGEYGLAVIAMLENLHTSNDRAPSGAPDRIRELANRIGLAEEVEKYRPD